MRWWPVIKMTQASFDAKSWRIITIDRIVGDFNRSRIKSVDEREKLREHLSTITRTNYYYGSVWREWLIPSKKKTLFYFPRGAHEDRHLFRCAGWYIGHIYKYIADRFCFFFLCKHASMRPRSRMDNHIACDNRDNRPLLRRTEYFKFFRIFAGRFRNIFFPIRIIYRKILRRFDSINRQYTRHDLSYCLWKSVCRKHLDFNRIYTWISSVYYFKIYSRSCKMNFNA